MDIPHELYDYLEIDHHPDTWYEYSSNYARDLLNKFTLPDWEKLKLDYKKQKTQWQIRLIDILFSFPSNIKYDILESMVLSSEEPILSAAIEGLELNLPEYKAPFNITQHLIKIQKKSNDNWTKEKINNILESKGFLN